MQMCPDCDRVYDESEYSFCPYCSGILFDDEVRYGRNCPKCGGAMDLDTLYGTKTWFCTNCDYEFEGDEDDAEYVIG